MLSSAETPGNEALRQRAVLATIPGLIAYSMGQTVLFAVAGPVFREIGLSEIQLGMIVSAAALVFVAGSAIWGKLADTLGRKRVIVFGLGTYALTSFAFAGVLDFGLSGVLAVGAVFLSLLVIRLAYAALGAGIQPASVALMADLSSEEDRASSVAIVGAAFGLGMILGPAAAAFLVGWGVLVPLYAIAALGLICTLLAVLFLSEPERDETSGAKAKAPIDYNRLAPIMAATLLLFVGTSALQQTMAFYVQDTTGANAKDTARLTGICFVAMATMSLIAQGGIVQWLKPTPALLLRAGLPTMIVGLALYAYPPNFSFIIVAAGIIGLGFGLANPGLIAAASLRSDANNQGSAAGLTQAMMAAGYVVGPLSGTGLYEFSAQWTALLVAAVFGIATIIVCTLSFENGVVSSA